MVLNPGIPILVHVIIKVVLPIADLALADEGVAFSIWKSNQTFQLR